MKYIDPSGHNAFTDFFTKTIPDFFSNAWETIENWSWAFRDFVDWCLDSDKSPSDRIEDTKTEAAWWWKNRDWAISSAADIGITVMGGYGVAAFGKSFIKGVMADGIAARYAVRNPGTPDKAGITNPTPTRLARVIPGEGPFTTLGKSTDTMTWVTDANAIKGLNAQGISNALQPTTRSNVYTVIEWECDRALYVCPNGPTVPDSSINAPQWLIQNGPIPASATIRVVGQ